MYILAIAWQFIRDINYYLMSLTISQWCGSANCWVLVSNFVEGTGGGLMLWDVVEVAAFAMS
jgi:hypothetical protein